LGNWNYFAEFLPIKLIPDLKRALLDLKQKGYWISDFYIEEILKNYGIDF